MISQLVVPTDGSDPAYRAAEKVVELVQSLRQDAHITLLHVCSEAPSKGQLIQANFDVRTLLEEQAKRLMIKTEQLFQLHQLAYELVVRMGDPAQEILSYCRSNPCDLLIIGSRGLNRLRKLVLGSVSSVVLDAAPCPVMLVK